MPQYRIERTQTNKYIVKFLNFKPKTQLSGKQEFEIFENTLGMKQYREAEKRT